MSIFSAIAPSSKSIQKEYVDKRMRQLKRETSADSPKIRELILRLQAKHHVNPTLMPWTKTYTRLLMAMSMGDLTINLDAGDWFMKATPNTFATYKQTYERAQQPGGALALRDDEHNKAINRTIADDLTTLPDEWANAHRFSQRKRLYKALNASGADASMAGSVKDMKSNLLTKHPGLTLAGDGTHGVDTTNQRFKPKAKEVFAALNYARRLHGSNTTYGFSYLVLNPEFKRRALYYRPIPSTSPPRAPGARPASRRWARCCCDSMSTCWTTCGTTPTTNSAASTPAAAR